MLMKSLSLVAALLVSAGTIAHAQAQTRPNILVVSEDADEDTVPRGNRIFQRVIHELAETMNTRGYNVYDETAVGMDITKPGRVRRRDAEVIDVARSIPRPPIDVVLIFQIYASARKSSYSDIVRPEIRIPGRLLNVRTGQLIGSFEVTGLQLPPLPQDCDRECLLERVGAEARMLATDLAAALTDKLAGFIRPGGGSTLQTPGPDRAPPPAAYTPPVGGDADVCGMPTAFVIRVNGFTAPEMQAIEEYLSAFRCYEHQRPVRSSANHAEYWYETRAGSARISRNLRLMLEHMNVQGQVSFSGNTFVITKVATR